MPIVSKAGYTEELNRRLQLHPAYQPGMRFLHYPTDGAVEHATGYVWEPQMLGNPHPFNAVAHAVKDDGFGIA